MANVCPKCNEAKPRYQSNQRICKECFLARGRAYNAANADRLNEWRREWRLRQQPTLEMVLCPRCGLDKPKTAVDERTCRECRIERRQISDKNNPDLRIPQQRYRDKHRERLADQQRERYAADPNRREQIYDWQQANSEKVAEWKRDNKHRRRCRV